MLEGVMKPVINAVVGGRTSPNRTSRSRATRSPWGNFVTIATNSLLLAFEVFMMVRQINRLKREAAPPRR